MTPFEKFTRQQYLNLETFRRNGESMKTPVWFVQDEKTLYSQPHSLRSVQARHARLLASVCKERTIRRMMIEVPTCTHRGYPTRGQGVRIPSPQFVGGRAPHSSSSLGVHRAHSRS